MNQESHNIGSAWEQERERERSEEKRREEKREMENQDDLPT